MYCFKKSAALMVCALLAAQTLIACGSDDDGVAVQTTASRNDAAAVTEPEDDREPSGVPDTLDLNGEVIHMWCTTGAYEMINTEQTGDVLDDVTFAVNTAVQEKLNCTFDFVDTGFGSGTDNEPIATLLLADDTSFDLFFPVQWSGGSLVSEGMYLNIADAPYISLDQPWWDADYMAEMSIGNEKIFTLVGDYSIDRTRILNCIYYNKNMYADYYGDADGLYQTVLDGEWTLETLKRISEEVYTDLDGSGTVTLGDRLGSVQCWNAHTMAMLYCAGLRITERDENGIPYLVMGEEKNFDIIDAVYETSRNTRGIYFGTEVESVNIEAQDERFLSDNSMFYYGNLGSSESLRDMTSDYGVIPYPKYNTEQEEYHSMIGETMTFAALPYNCQKVDAVCAVLEQMAYDGYYDVLPTYYETVLKTKYARDNVSSQMIDLIRDGMVTDIALIYGGGFGGLCYAPRALIKDGSGDFASTYASMEKAALTSSEQLIERFTSMDD